MVQNDQKGTYHESSLWNEKQVCGQNALESPNDKEQRIYDLLPKCIVYVL